MQTVQKLLKNTINGLKLLLFVITMWWFEESNCISYFKIVTVYITKMNKQ